MVDLRVVLVVSLNAQMLCLKSEYPTTTAKLRILARNHDHENLWGWR